MTKILYGKPPAEHIISSISHSILQKVKTGFRCPCLSVVGVGKNSSNYQYLARLEKLCCRTNIKLQYKEFKPNVDTCILESHIRTLNTSNCVDGILVFQPFDNNSILNPEVVKNYIDQKKDVDALTFSSQANLYLGYDAFMPATAQACLYILDFYGIPVESKHVVVVGRSYVVGRPLACALTGLDATVTLCHSKTANLKNITKSADIVIVAIGKDSYFGPQYFVKNQVVIDVGINWNSCDNKIHGDVDFPSVCSSVAAITPSPGGVGVVTSAMLLKNVIRSYNNQIIS